MLREGKEDKVKTYIDEISKAMNFQETIDLESSIRIFATHELSKSALGVTPYSEAIQAALAGDEEARTEREYSQQYRKVGLSISYGNLV